MPTCYATDTMIRPEEFEKAVCGIRFLCGCTTSGRQYTFVEVSVEDRTDRAVSVSFCVPDNSKPRDECILLETLSGNGTGGVINEAMDAWGECRTNLHERQIAVLTAFQNAPSTVSAEVSGCKMVATIVIPSGGECIVNACWSHDVVKSRWNKGIVFIPTFNENLSSWRVDAIVMHGNTHNHGRPPHHSFSRSFRHDLASPALAATGQEPFIATDGAMLIRRWGPSLPYHNIHVPLSASNSREHESLCGAVVVDKTSRRLMTFYDVMFVAVPCICGAYIRNSVSYPNCNVPLTITERLSRRSPVEFRDASDGSACVDVYVDEMPMFRIDPRNRTVQDTLHWVDIILFSHLDITRD